MADITKTAGPNKTAEELEKNRKDSIRNAFAGSRPTEEEPETEEKPKNQEKSEEKLDKDENNSYINKEGKSSEESQEQPKDEEEPSEENKKYKEIFEKQFGKDGVKAAKSWSQAQSEYTKLQQKLKQHREVIDKLDDVVEKNPFLEDMIKKAREKGQLSNEDLQSFLQRDREPSGKPNTSSNKSKLEIVDEDFDIDDVDEEVLAEEKLLDLSRKDVLSDAEWQVARQKAAIKYAQRNLPNKIADKAYKQFEQQISEKQKQVEQEKRQKQNKEINSERYQQGIQKVVEKFGLDFAGNEEHRKALEEIERRASFIRDPDNSSVIRPNAIYLATLEMVEEGELDVNQAPDVNTEAKKAGKKAEEELEERSSGFNKSASSTAGGGEPDTISGKLRQRRLQEYQKEQDIRRKTDRLHDKSTN